MESTKFPVVIKKRNGVMIGVSILEIVMGIFFGIVGGGIKSPLLWIFVFTGIISALSVFVEYSQDILIKENKLEFYKNNDLIKEIKYINITSIDIDKGNEPKTKRKDFFTISIGSNDKNSNRTKNSKIEKYLVNPSNYSAKDLITIKNIITSKNSSVKVNRVEEYFNINESNKK
jgi:hypothetical protein